MKDLPSLGLGQLAVAQFADIVLWHVDDAILFACQSSSVCAGVIPALRAPPIIDHFGDYFMLLPTR
jgi:hypothetical protein